MFDQLPPDLRVHVVGFLLPEEIRTLIRPLSKNSHDLSHSPLLWHHVKQSQGLFPSLIFNTNVITERRSKGSTFIAAIEGHRENTPVPLLVGPWKTTSNSSPPRRIRCSPIPGVVQPLVHVRRVGFDVANAGDNDGAPTSVLREIAASASLRHQNVVRLLDVELHADAVYLITELFGHSLAHAKLLQEIKTRNLTPRLAIGEIMRQLFEGLDYVHKTGVAHRNLKPENVFVEWNSETTSPKNTVEDFKPRLRIGDFFLSRILDVPRAAYTPEIPKLRESSSREDRRLYFRAPETLLRFPYYDEKVDLWAAGALLASLGGSNLLFQHPTEIGMLFSIFRVCGTPTSENWQLVNHMGLGHQDVPIYKGICFRQIARVAMDPYSRPLEDIFPDSVLEPCIILIELTKLVGIEALHLLEQLLILQPQMRISAECAKQHPFCQRSIGPIEERADVNPAILKWMKEEPLQDPERLSLDPIHMKNVRRDNAHFGIHALAAKVLSASKKTPPPTVVLGDDLEPLEPTDRAELVDLCWQVREEFDLSEQTVHLAVQLFDEVLPRLNPYGRSPLNLCITVCMKVADIFNETSREYYRQENAREYSQVVADLCQLAVEPEDLIELETSILRACRYHFYEPTTRWFVRCLYEILGLEWPTPIHNYLEFVADYSLYDCRLNVFMPSMRAVAVLIVAFTRGFVEEGAIREATATNVREMFHRWEETQAFAKIPLDVWDLEACCSALLRCLRERRRELNLAGCTQLDRNRRVGVMAAPEAITKEVVDFFAGRAAA